MQVMYVLFYMRDHLKMLILLDGSWKPETSLSTFVYKSGEWTQIEMIRKERLLQKIIFHWHSRVSMLASHTSHFSSTLQRFLHLRWLFRRNDVLPTQMVLVESSLLPWAHSQLKDPATLRHAPLMHGLDSHSLISETHASAHLRSGPRGWF